MGAGGTPRGSRLNSGAGVVTGVELGGPCYRHNVGARDRLVKMAGVPSSGGPGRWARCLISGRKLAPRP